VVESMFEMVAGRFMLGMVEYSCFPLR